MLERPIDLAHRALGHRLHGAFGILDVEEIIADAVRLDPPQHGEIDVDDVLVAGQHQAFFRHVAHGPAAPRRIVDQRHADRDGGDAQRLRQQHGLDRIRQMIVQARLHGAHMLAEAQHDAELFGLDAEESGQSPDRQRADQDQRDADAAEMTAGQQAAGAGPGRGAEGPQDRAASARPIAGRSPMALSDPSPTGLRLDSSTASTISSAGQWAKMPGLSTSARLYRGRPRPLQRKLLARSSYA